VYTKQQVVHDHIAFSQLRSPTEHFTNHTLNNYMHNYINHLASNLIIIQIIEFKKYSQWV